jgi:hypothetical protein
MQGLWLGTVSVLWGIVLWTHGTNEGVAILAFILTLFGGLATVLSEYNL